MMSPVRKVEHTAEANAEWSRFAVRNSSRYRIGEVASLLGITPQAVRYYEEEGIINPERNPLSGYRYYSAWDINMLMRIRTYRQQGFSIEEIRDVMREFNPGLTVSYLGEKAQALHDTICEQIVYMNRLRDEQSVVEEARVGYRRFVVTYRPPMHFLQTQRGYNLLSEHLDLYRTWITEHAAFVLPGGVFQGPGADDVAYGLFVDDANLRDIGYKNEEEVVAIPSLLCLSTSFVSGSDVELSYQSFDFALDYIAEKGWQVAGSPVSRIAMMANQERSYRSLHRVWIPIKGEGIEPDDKRDDDMLAHFVGSDS